ncbi:Uncharacterized membrane protein YjjP, DUF1212 family [Nocardioides alpinus]|uniref:Uncharacterized membrane protein YjjP, DUF1212 family n=1 Tax=Nocardioides alpinus TaxID=748909 RepID=A0A1I0XVW9_9ACTN|nr:threonine/serine exporter family protein [Nocardioides alpinus]SFB04596.1 Uncharacterized membrane protein YjjP, DUF1212 family [Nocardioides alpinus]
MREAPQAVASVQVAGDGSALADSPVPAASAWAALAVLVVAVLAVRRIHRREAVARRRSTSVTEPPSGPGVLSGAAAGSGTADVAAVWESPDPRDEALVIAFVIALGVAMVDSGASVTQVTATLRRVAAVNGVPEIAIAVLPTALFVSMPGAESVQTAIAPAGDSLRLDQVGAVFAVVDDAEAALIGPQAGLAALVAAGARPAPYAPWLRLAGYPLLAAGLILIVRGTWWEMLTAVVLATGAGTLQLHRSEVPAAYRVFLPVATAFGCSLSVFLLIRAGADIGVFAPLLAVLVTFLPGAQLTTAVIELATGQMVAGVGRLAHGLMTLTLLAIGIVTASQLVGVPAHSLPEPSLDGFGVLSPWLGVLVFGAGVVLTSSVELPMARWVVSILLVAYAGQVVGGTLLGEDLSAFTGALVMTPLAMLVAELPTGPPTLVTFMPAFWLLVPGAAGLAGVAKYLGDQRADGVTSLLAAGGSMLGIAFGVLLGLAVGAFLGLGSGVSMRAAP